MKNKFIVAMLLVVFGYKNSTAQITQSTIKPISSNKAKVNPYQYSVTLLKDSSFRVPNPYVFTAYRDTNYYPHYILQVTGAPNDTAVISMSISQKTNSSWYDPKTLGTVWYRLLVIGNDGITTLKLKTDGLNYPDLTPLEQDLSIELSKILQNKVKVNYIGANFYSLGAGLYFSKGGSKTYFGSTVIF